MGDRAIAWPAGIGTGNRAIAWPAGIGPELIVAGLEFIAGLAVVGWVIESCPGASPHRLWLGTLGALVPDLVDLPLRMLFRITLLHVPALHWTVARRHAVWGILSQVAVAGAALMVLWRTGGCG
jgi:hypothetical protein